MLAQGTIRESDYIASTFLESRPRPAPFISGLVVSVGTVLLLSLSIGLLYSMAVLLFFFAFLVLVLYFTAKKNFRTESDPLKPMTIEIREDGLLFKKEGIESRLVAWSDFVKWKKTKRLVLLYPAGASLFLIPDHFFKTEAHFQRFLTMVESKLGKAGW